MDTFDKVYLKRERAVEMANELQHRLGWFKIEETKNETVLVIECRSVTSQPRTYRIEVHCVEIEA